MKRLFVLFALVFISLAFASHAQVAITNFSGTTTYGSLGVTVTSAGGVTTYTSSCLGLPSEYWIGYSTSGSYTYTLSRPVYEIDMQSYALNGGEYFQVYINGAAYSITPSDTITMAGCSSTSWCYLSGGLIYGPASGTSDYAGPSLAIHSCTPINSFTFYCYTNSGMTYHVQVDTNSTCLNAFCNAPCLNDSLHLYAQGDSTGATYSWTGPGGFTSTQQNPNIFPTAYSNSGTYTVTKTTGSSTQTSSVVVTVHLKPILNVTTNSPVCAGSDITFTTTPDSTATGELFSWTGPHSFGATVASPTVIACTPLDSGFYTVIANLHGCLDTAIVDVAVNEVPTPTAANNSPLCSGSSIIFSATDALSGVSYSWSGPGGYTSATQNPVITNATVAESGTYSVVANMFGCTSPVATTIVTVNQTPEIASVQPVDPTPCRHSDGSLILNGLTASATYDVTYSMNGVANTVTLVADASGNVTITGLPKSFFNNIYVVANGCRSNTVGPFELKDPGIPPTPTASSNSPVCEKGTLALFATDSASNVVYSWAGPGGYTVTAQNPVRTNIGPADAGPYTVTVSNGTCTSWMSTLVVVNPSVTLISVSPDETIIFGSSIQLNALGALFYKWSPEDGSLNNENINNPLATPQQTTVYEVKGMNNFGCGDSAHVKITVKYTDSVGVPTAFTPNGDGLNDIFRIVNPQNFRLVAFSVTDRWGKVVYENNGNIRQGWDGTFNGVPQDIGVYNYMIILAAADGNNQILKGTVTLVR